MDHDSYELQGQDDMSAESAHGDGQPIDGASSAHAPSSTLSHHGLASGSARVAANDSKPQAPEPPPGVSKRTMQNRKAQRDFRLRRATYVKDLEERVRRYEIDQFNNKVAMQNDRTELYRLRQENERLLDENQRLRTHIERVTGERVPQYLEPSPSFVSSHPSYLGSSFGPSVLSQPSSSLVSSSTSSVPPLDQSARPSFGPTSLHQNVGVPALPSASTSMLSSSWDQPRRHSDDPSRSMSDHESPHSQSGPSAPISPLAPFPPAPLDPNSVSSNRTPRTAVWHNSMTAPLTFGPSVVVDDRRRAIGLSAPSTARPSFGGPEFVASPVQSTSSNHARQASSGSSYQTGGSAGASYNAGSSASSYQGASLGSGSIASGLGRIGSQASTSPLLYPLSAASNRPQSYQPISPPPPSSSTVEPAGSAQSFAYQNQAPRPSSGSGKHR